MLKQKLEELNKKNESLGLKKRNLKDKVAQLENEKQH